MKKERRNVFDLEKSVADWRRQMRGVGLKNPGLLDELEGHLREDIEARTRAGLAEEAVFAAAVAQIGQGCSIKTEFAKIGGINFFHRFTPRKVLAFAGNANRYLNDSFIPPENPEPAWATYLKAVFFTAPVVLLWSMAMIWCMPVVMKYNNGGLPGPIQTNLNISRLFWDKGNYFVMASMVALLLMEWRSKKWGRCRRFGLGLATFVLNFAFLVSLFLFFVTAAILLTMAGHPVH